jgi:ankyrin repeat protein
MTAKTFLSRSFAKVSSGWQEQLNDRLVSALKAGTAEEARSAAAEALALGANPNDKGYLHDACRKGFSGVAQLLLDAGAKVDGIRPGEVTPFMAAAENGDAATMKLLADAGADVEKTDALGFNALTRLVAGASIVSRTNAAEKTRFREAYDFLKARGMGLDDNAKQRIYLNHSSDAYLEPDLERQIAFSDAVKQGDLAFVDDAMKQGLHPDFASKYGANRALYDAITQGDEQMVRTLVTGGASVKKHFSQNGDSPLVAAINADKPDVFRALVELGADPAKKLKFSQQLSTFVREVSLSDYARQKGLKAFGDLIDSLVNKPAEEKPDIVDAADFDDVTLQQATTIRGPLRLIIPKHSVT